MTLKVLIIGDIMGKAGRKAVAHFLPALREEYGIDTVIANAENLAHGKGVTRTTLREMTDAGVDCFTSGNHVWAKPEGVEILSAQDSVLLRPANYPPQNPGQGEKILSIATKSLLVVNLMGRDFMPAGVDCPFRALDAILAKHASTPLNGIIVDFHGEVTSEKHAIALYADGRVSAVVGTHTHVPTADERILPKGTGFQSDIGMCGVRDTLIGITYESGIQRFLSSRPTHFEVAESGLTVFNSVLLEIDPKTRQTVRIERIGKELTI
ncbi:TIGR00282 family metallophosphoesterase [Candidatus Uhrbacteria bacterium]|nr:TIGR00282 family metallophosphoesterase [Candidatus Uhrbacteria bacterium]